MRVLILQGPFGGFFSHLARYLSDHGHDVKKINFNAGDLFYSWRFSGIINYNKGLPRWRKWLRRLLTRWRPEAILLFGDQRPIHRIARRVAKDAGIPVYCFEEGYIRPHFVTFERNGNNAHSPLPRDPALYEVPVEEKPAQPMDLPHHFPRVVWSAIGYFMAKAAGQALFPRYLHHRRRALFSEAFLWSRSYARYLFFRKRDQRTAQALLSSAAPNFFLAILQVHDDMQLVRHGNGWRNRRFIEEVISSFSAQAPPEVTLVMKVHPMDRGHRNYRREIRHVAQSYGVDRRVIVLESGPLAPTARKARGLITINSTSGIAAIEGNTPVLVFGKGLYSIPGLVTAASCREDLDSFWTSPMQPDPVLAHRFLTRLRAQSLIPGSFYYPPSWDALCAAVETRIGAHSLVPRPVVQTADADVPAFGLELPVEQVALSDS